MPIVRCALRLQHAPHPDCKGHYALVKLIKSSVKVELAHDVIDERGRGWQ